MRGALPVPRAIAPLLQRSGEISHRSPVAAEDDRGSRCGGSLREQSEAQADERAGTWGEEKDQADVPEQAEAPGRTDGAGELHGQPALEELAS